MGNAKTRELILSRIRKGLAEPTSRPVPKPDFVSPIYSKAEASDDLAMQFADVFVKAQGAFIYCESEEDVMVQLFHLIEEKNWKNIHAYEPLISGLLEPTGIELKQNAKNLEHIDCAITCCEALLARTGSILISSKQEAGRGLSAYAPSHVVVAFASQLVPDIKEGLAMVADRYESDYPSMVSMITGPSRTADIEKTLVLGAHGPKELFLFLIDDDPA